MSSAPDPEDAEMLKALADGLKAEGGLGRGGRLSDLFDYLLARTLAGDAPKEQEIGVDVFAKNASHPADDATVRVYVHRLRKKLSDYYKDLGEAAPSALTIPKGEYKLVVQPRLELDSASAAEAALPARSVTLPVGVIAVAVIAFLVCLAGWVSVAMDRDQGETDPYQSAIWAPLKNSQRPLVLVVGDYYMFGEYRDKLFLTRLIRDFEINSKDDLTREMREQPDLFSQYADVSLEYLPTSVAFAMADISPVMAAKNPWTVLASDLMPESVKCCDIIYVGLTSGMGPLHDAIFARSSYKIGDTYDEIIDTRTNEKFVSEAFLAAPGETMYRDYALFSMFEGPSGNTIWAFAGTRDTGLMGLTESLTDPDWVRRKLSAKAGQPGYEALFEITGQKHVNLDTRLVSEGISSKAGGWTSENSSPTD
ncbi:helix-turn-helix domain-containing protein [Henriciella litoralis]|uniref:helix-turn-helix domain-containing protein n=1 Tax=Henriciella litoralis TaxID=568102 RepID=UPI000A051AAB|nr:helix-turn-helix domain-containing protein [Henriciella litoralis]